MNLTMEQLTNFAATYGLKVIGAIFILVVGRIAAGFVRKLVKRALGRAAVDTAIVGFVASFVYILVQLFAVLAALAKFGVQTASFVALLGAAGFAVGFALQGSLSHFAAGVMILIFRPFKVGDIIDAAGVMGSVNEIRMFTTVMSTPDNINLIVPNGKIFGDIIKNFSVNDTRRIDVTVGIGYGMSIDRAMEVALEVMKSDERIIQEPQPQIFVTNLGDSSVDLMLRCWTKRSDFWAAKWDLTKNIKDNFDLQSIEIPFPQRVVHMSNAS